MVFQLKFIMGVIINNRPSFIPHLAILPERKSSKVAACTKMGGG
jgi:hypothetical protein